MNRVFSVTVTLTIVLLMAGVSFAQRRPGGPANNQGGPPGSTTQPVDTAISEAANAQRSAVALYRNPDRDRSHDRIYTEGARKLGQARAFKRRNVQRAITLANDAKANFVRYTALMRQRPAGTVHGRAVLKVAEAHRLFKSADSVRKTSEKYKRYYDRGKNYYNASKNYLSRGGDANDRQAIITADKSIKFFKFYLRKHGFRNR